MRRVSTAPPRAQAAADLQVPATATAFLRSSGFRKILLAALALAAFATALAVLNGRSEAGLSRDGQITVVVFAIAVWAWVFTNVDDTYVALGSTVTLVLTGVLSTEGMFAALGDDTVWLLLAAFIISSGVTSSGLAMRATAYVATAARTPRQLFHLLTGALLVTTFAVPSTSGRAALAMPVFVSLAVTLSRRPQLVRAIAVLFPTVILLSAVGSLLGAGAHLITSKILQTATGSGLTFVEWLLLGLPLAIVASHLSAELVLRLFTSGAERSLPIKLETTDFRGSSETPVTGPLSAAQSRSALLLAGVVMLWCSEPLHGIDPAIVALVGALVAASPRYGSVTLNSALKSAPWSLLLFLAATLALGSALTASGAAEWLAGAAFSGFTEGNAAVPFIVTVIIISTAMHLIVQSRSARSSVLVPIVVALAPAVGADPVAAAMASTAAAGFCHTLPSSAKPVALFAKVEGQETYTPKDLGRLSLFLAPISAGLVAFFVFGIWPLLGTPYK